MRSYDLYKSAMSLLEVRNLVKRYASPDGEAQTIVEIPEFNLDASKEVALRGESGSGKTTFLHLLSGILRPDSGSISFDGADITRFGEQELDRTRAQKIGYIFQTFNLLQGFTCLENVLLAMAFGTTPDRGRAEELLKRVGMEQRLNYFPGQLSTGQQQRVAVARALANRPKLVMADEPTGNLDRAYASSALSLIREICREHGAALLLVSHDEHTLGQFSNVQEFSNINRAPQVAAATL